MVALKASDRLQAQLQQEFRMLSGEALALKKRVRALHCESEHDTVDLAQWDAPEPVLFEVGSHVRERLTEIQDALTRLGNGSYGICLDCKQPIPPIRLEALPCTPRCVDCQQEAEYDRMPVRYARVSRPVPFSGWNSDEPSAPSFASIDDLTLGEMA